MREDFTPDDRDANGRFVAGNRGGPGNPLGKRVASLRRALLEAVTDDDIREIMCVLVAQAKKGNLQAAREVVLRTVGRPLETDLLERMDEIEEAVGIRSGDR